MTSWWETKRFADVQMQDCLREAARARQRQKAGGAVARYPVILQVAADWLRRRTLSPARRFQERDCANSAQVQSSSRPFGLIL